MTKFASFYHKDIQILKTIDFVENLKMEKIAGDGRVMFFASLWCNTNENQYVIYPLDINLDIDSNDIRKQTFTWKNGLKILCQKTGFVNWKNIKYVLVGVIKLSSMGKSALKVHPVGKKHQAEVKKVHKKFSPAFSKVSKM